MEGNNVQQYNDNVEDEIGRELLVEFLKQGICVTYPPQVAELYCRQLDDAKRFIKLLEKMSNNINI